MNVIKFEAINLKESFGFGVAVVIALTAIIILKLLKKGE
jgi:hypothetical protein